MYDAIIVGAGPAGSTAARLLAAKGAKVLLLDKQKFPRDKPCGGGVTLRASSEVDIDLTPIIEQTVYGARFSLRLKKGFDRRFEKPLTYMTQRARLDAHLAQCAAEAGAEFHDGEAVRSIEVAGAPTVRTDQGRYSSEVLIGADGANGIVGAAAGLRFGAVHAVALEQAALSAELDVETLDGNATLTIPAGTQSGKVLRMRGKGVPTLRSSGRGDQLVHVYVEVPTRLNAQQRELLEEFAELSGGLGAPASRGFLDKLRDIFE